MRAIVVALPILLLVFAGGQAAVSNFVTEPEPVPAAAEPALLDAGQPTVHARESAIEDATGVHYQHDFGVEGDAPGACADLDTARVLTIDDGMEHATLVEGDDESDVFYTQIPPTTLGGRVGLSLDLDWGTPADDVSLEYQTLAFDVLDSDCGYSLFDPAAPIYQPIDPQPGAGEKVVYADLDYKCKNKDYWKFHISGDGPESLFIEWTNGEWELQSFVDSNDGSGNYITTANTGYDLRTVEAVVSSDWDGNFRVVQAPCNTVDGGADPVERQVPAPSKGDLYGEFDVRATSYVIHVYMVEGVAGTTLGGAPSIASQSPVSPGPLDLPKTRSCDQSTCPWASFTDFQLDGITL